MTKLKQLREAAGLTQAELAKKSGVKLSMIQFYEQGVKDLKRAAFETGLRIAEALDCNPRELISK